jgi:hypothetical protein
MSKYLSHEVVKPVFVGLSCIVLDNQIIGRGKMDPYAVASSIVFGISATAAVVGSSYIAPHLSGGLTIPDTVLYSGKTLEVRLLEVSIGATGAYMVNSLLGSNDSASFVGRLGIFAMADVCGEYLADAITGEPLSYLK